MMIIALAIAAVTTVSAHKPSYANDHTTSQKAFEVIDPDISIALYAEMTCTADTLWMHMDTEGIDEVWIELGVPELDRLSDYRPSVAIVAEGLPEADVPFELPANMGARVIHTDEVEVPEDFFEPFTQTSSWVLFQDWVEVPTDTDVYLVAYNPEEITGKLWVAVGKTEDFSDVEVSQFGEWVDKTQAFHEVGDEEEHFEIDCSELYDPNEPAVETKTPAAASGCASVASGRAAGTWSLAMAVLMVGFRRRSGAQ
jgi:hypothetical protein